MGAKEKTTQCGESWEDVNDTSLTAETVKEEEIGENCQATYGMTEVILLGNLIPALCLPLSS